MQMFVEVFSLTRISHLMQPVLNLFLQIQSSTPLCGLQAIINSAWSRLTPRDWRWTGLCTIIATNGCNRYDFLLSYFLSASLSPQVIVRSEWSAVHMTRMRRLSLGEQTNRKHFPRKYFLTFKDVISLSYRLLPGILLQHADSHFLRHFLSARESCSSSFSPNW